MWTILLIVWAVGVISAWPTTTYACRANYVRTPLGEFSAPPDSLTKKHVFVGFILALFWPLWLLIRLYRMAFEG
jgi:hypothetical protein